MNAISAFKVLGIPLDDMEHYSIRLNNVMDHLDPWNLSDSETLFDHLFGCRWDKNQKRRIIRGDIVLQFLQLRAGSPLFVFMGGFKIDKDEHGQPVSVACELPDHPEFEYFEWRDDADRKRQVDRFKPYVRRLVVRFVRKSGRKYNRMDFNLATSTYADDFLQGMTVEYVRSTPYELSPFPGYSNVLLTHAELVRAVRDESWCVALGNVQAVYLQTDRSNGWHYVGSAYSQDGERQGLLSRWTEYAEGDHTGGNALLKAFDNPKEHIERYFQYSILEVFDMKTDKSVIIDREHWWMRALSSIRSAAQGDADGIIPHGYNSF